MKIIFDSFEERERILDKLTEGNICPDELGINYSPPRCNSCSACWDEAIKKIEENCLVDDRK